MAFSTTALCILLITVQGISGEIKVFMLQVEEKEVGQPAQIECQASISEPTTEVHVQWFFLNGNKRERIYFMDSKHSVADNGTEYTGRISMDKNYTLTIHSVTLRDQGTFICQVGAGAVGKNENRTELRVYDAPELPEIKGEETGIAVTEESSIPKIAHCISRNGYPPPNITWYKDQTPLQDQEGVTSVQATLTKESSGLFSVESHLFHRVTKKDKDSKFYCEINYQMPGINHMMESSKIGIILHYPMEQLKFLRVFPDGPIKEGDTVKFECRGDGNPPPEYSFYKNNQGIDVNPAFDQGLLILENVTQMSTGTYECRGLDLETVTELNKEVNITVNYLTNITLTPDGPLELAVGEDKTLSCNAHASALTAFQWEKSDMEVFTGGNSLHLTNVNYSSTGTYTCEVTVPTVPGLVKSKSILITVSGKPEVTAPQNKLWVYIGEEVNLTCVAFGHPEAEITWNVAGNLTVRHRGDHTVTSQLTVKVVPELLRLGITCNASNMMGSGQQSFQLYQVLPTTHSTAKTDDIVRKKQKNPESSGVIIVAVIVCILLLAVLGATLYFLYKKGKISCGRSGKQDITRPEDQKDIIMELKTDKVQEEAGLLQGANGDKKPPRDQGEQYIDLRN
ncbi:cell surface glycoprotein MUC18 isoform X1 [Latimeria chalumnae]|nr:PREDICTED: cell surface glycoprotein MUC18 isoform X1 [Latimeria chalumnae]|eukprot:XP_005988170.1 PREDICTED: cell surface glycoprotein MUC18 isoform X1 [Latimeria chalumnae]